MISKNDLWHDYSFLDAALSAGLGLLGTTWPVSSSVSGVVRMYATQTKVD